MSLKFFKAWKILLPAGLLLVLVQGLLQVPELQDYLLPGEYFQSELRATANKCLDIEGDLTSYRERVATLEGLLASKNPDRKVSAARMLRSPWSEGVQYLSPELVWKVDLYLAKRTRVKVERNLKYIDYMLSNLELMKPALSQNNAEQIPLNPAGGDFTQEIRARSQIYSREIKNLSEKLTRLEGREQKALKAGLSCKNPN